MKTLKTMFTTILSLALCLMMFSACQSSKPDPQSGSNTTTTTTTEATTTTTEAVTTTTEATTTTTEPVDEFTLNEDRLSEIGKSYSELEEKHGEPSVVRYYEGGVFYYLKNSNCGYFFGKHDRDAFNKAPRNDDGTYPGETAPRPSEDATCKQICKIRVNQLFNGLSESVSPTELAEMYGLEHLWSEQIMFYQNNSDGEYMSEFRYGDYELLIHAHENYLIGPDSMIDYIGLTEE